MNFEQEIDNLDGVASFEKDCSFPIHAENTEMIYHRIYLLLKKTLKFERKKKKKNISS